MSDPSTDPTTDPAAPTAPTAGAWSPDPADGWDGPYGVRDRLPAAAYTQRQAVQTLTLRSADPASALQWWRMNPNAADTTSTGA